MTHEPSNIKFDENLVDGRFLVVELFAARTDYKERYVKKQLRTGKWQGKRLYKKWYVDWLWWSEQMRLTPLNRAS